MTSIAPSPPAPIASPLLATDNRERNVELDSFLSALRFERGCLEAEIDKLHVKAPRLRRFPHFLENLCYISKDAKVCIINIDAYIAKARELELCARERLPARPAATDSLSICS